MGGNNDSRKECGLTQLLIFVAAIVSGTACSLCSKLMMEMHSTGVTGETEKFTKPIFQTFGMFVGMTFGIVMHWLVLAFKIPFPGYVHRKSGGEWPNVEMQNQGDTERSWVPTESDSLLEKGKATVAGGDDGEEEEPASSELPVWMYFVLGIPSVFDLGATALCMMGLQFLDVSIYQMLRGSGIIFVALMKQHVLGDHLFRFQWVGVFWNVVSVVLVGLTAMLASAQSEKEVEASDAVWGVLLVMAGAFVQALQFVFEEKVMTMDIPAPPLLLIGMEGIWGTVLCLVVVYPLAYFMPGDDHGSYEDPFNTYEMIMNSSTIKWAFVIYFFTIFAYNLFAVLVTFMLSMQFWTIFDQSPSGRRTCSSFTFLPPAPLESHGRTGRTFNLLVCLFFCMAQAFTTRRTLAQYRSRANGGRAFWTLRPNTKRSRPRSLTHSGKRCKNDSRRGLAPVFTARPAHTCLFILKLSEALAVQRINNMYRYMQIYR